MNDTWRKAYAAPLLIRDAAEARPGYGPVRMIEK